MRSRAHTPSGNPAGDFTYNITWEGSRTHLIGDTKKKKTAALCFSRIFPIWSESPETAAAEAEAAVRCGPLP